MYLFNLNIFHFALILYHHHPHSKRSVKRKCLPVKEGLKAFKLKKGRKRKKKRKKI